MVCGDGSDGELHEIWVAQWRQSSTDLTIGTACTAGPQMVSIATTTNPQIEPDWNNFALLAGIEQGWKVRPPSLRWPPSRRMWNVLETGGCSVL